MTRTTIPRVIYCGAEDALFKKLSRCTDFVLDAKPTGFQGTPQKFARRNKASVLILKVKKKFDLKHQEWLSRHDASVPILAICQDGSVEVAVHALQYGVFDYFGAEQNLETILNRIREAIAWKSSRMVRKSFEQQQTLLHGETPEILKINEQARTLAKESKPVMIYGESGTGKEHLAYGMYRTVFRKNLVPFLHYDCRLIQQISRYDGKSVPDWVLNRLQELRNKSARGVLFLSHLEHVPADERGEIFQRGSSGSLKLIGSFQEPAQPFLNDNQITSPSSIQIPPLRQHPKDIPTLAEHFIRSFAEKESVRLKALSEDMVVTMQEYSWPGNVQELSNLIERMMAIEPSSVLSQNTWRICQGYGLQLNVDNSNRLSQLLEVVLKNNADQWKSGKVYNQFLEKMRRLLIDVVLTRVNHNQAVAARILGISRNTLRDSLRNQ